MEGYIWYTIFLYLSQNFINNLTKTESQARFVHETTVYLSTPGDLLCDVTHI